MRTLTLRKIKELVSNGLIECQSEMQGGYVGICWLTTGRCEQVEVLPTPPSVEVAGINLSTGRRFQRIFRDKHAAEVWLKRGSYLVLVVRSSDKIYTIAPKEN
jgi:hypothetical protein